MKRRVKRVLATGSTDMFANLVVPALARREIHVVAMVHDPGAVSVRATARRFPFQGQLVEGSSSCGGGVVWRALVH